MSNYPPGVTGNEPHLTGIWPCPVCDGEPPGCWFCSHTGVAPEDPPPCPECGHKDTEFPEELPHHIHEHYADTHNVSIPYDCDHIWCDACHKVSPPTS